MGQHIDMEQMFLKLYDEQATSLFRHCYFRVSSRELAEDLTQEAFLRTWNSLVGGKPIENPKAFLYRVAENLIVDHYRKKKEISLDTLSEKGFDVRGEGAEAIIDSSAAREAKALIDELPPAHRDILVLRYIDDFSIREIADIIGGSENVVSVRVHRALERLKKILTHGKSS